jgi:2'-5' RNA ligase
MRLFIAVNFNDDTRSRLIGLRDELRRRSKRGNFSAPENLHLTLVFLGECDVERTNAVKSLLDQATFGPFGIVIDRVGRFERGGGGIWWAGVYGSEPLLHLQRSLTDELADAGFETDRRKYSPHVMLGREIVTDAAPWKITPFGETVGSIELMKSERLSGRLTYTAIHGRGAERDERRPDDKYGQDRYMSTFAR